MKDFANQGDRYLQYRPAYPMELFRWLAALTSDRAVAWDCGTGSGQSALGLAPYFESVLATDFSRSQLRHAKLESKVQYALARAEDCPLQRRTVDLVTVACALHWFDIDSFFQEVMRVLRTSGVLAVWTYTWPVIECESVDRILRRFKDEVLGPYWPPESGLYFERYENLRFPFIEVEVNEEFAISCPWSPEDLLQFLGTWSGAQRFAQAKNRDPAKEIRADLIEAWDDAMLSNKVTLPLYLRVGRLL